MVVEWVEVEEGGVEELPGEPGEQATPTPTETHMLTLEPMAMLQATAMLEHMAMPEPMITQEATPLVAPVLEKLPGRLQPELWVEWYWDTA